MVSSKKLATDQQRLAKNIWNDERYYQLIERVDDLSHPAFQKIRKYLKSSQVILDLGCGDGSKLTHLISKKKTQVGIDISLTGLKRGSKKYSLTNLSVGVGEFLPFKDHVFDAIMSFFVLEHTLNPQMIINEIDRVLKPKGRIILLAPNYGAPNRASPNFQGSRILKLLWGGLNDLNLGAHSLNWRSVQPPKQSMVNFISDLDTTVEPYLGSLLLYLHDMGYRIEESNSYWDMEQAHPKKLQQVFSRLSSLGIFPFTQWGPHLFLVAQKND